MQRKAVIVVALLYLLKRTYRYVKECIKHEQLIARIRNMAVYSVAEMKELLTKSPPGHKVYCFVRGLITSKNAFDSLLDKTKKLAWSVVVKTDLYSNRPKQIIDTLDLSDKLIVAAPKVAKALKLKDLITDDVGHLVSSNVILSITNALSEINTWTTRYPASILRSLRSFFARLMQPFILLGRIFRGAPIKYILVELGIMENSHVLVMGNCRFSQTQGLLVEAQVATKDRNIYLKHLARLQMKNLKHLLVMIMVIWLLVIIFSRDLQQLYQMAVRWVRPQQNQPQQQHEQHSDSEDNTFSCYICYSKVRTMVFTPCKHYGICRSCYNYLESKQCPTCKADIESVIEVQKDKQLQ